MMNYEMKMRHNLYYIKCAINTHTSNYKLLYK